MYVSSFLYLLWVWDCDKEYYTSLLFYYCISCFICLHNIIMSIDLIKRLHKAKGYKQEGLLAVQEVILQKKIDKTSL